MKKHLRNYLTSKRNSLTLEEQVKYSKEIHEKLISLPQWKNSKTIMIYISINSEVMTLNLISKTIKERKILILPKVSNKDIITIKVNNEFKITTGYKGILEPSDGEIFTGYIDTVILPLIGFDKEGYRIGYGGGFYDAFIAKNSNRIGMKIGLAYECQKVDSIPKEEHDQKLDIVITEKNVYIF